MRHPHQLEAPPDGRTHRETSRLDGLLRPIAVLPRQQRRLPECILVAAHQACDIGELEVADRLLSVLDTVLARGSSPPSAAQRRVVEGMVAAYERLWHLRGGAGPAAG